MDNVRRTYPRRHAERDGCRFGNCVCDCARLNRLQPPSWFMQQQHAGQYLVYFSDREPVAPEVMLLQLRANESSAIGTDLIIVPWG